MPPIRYTVAAALIAAFLVGAIIAATWHHNSSQSAMVDNGRHFLGAEDAPFHVMEFADFQCPYCASLALSSIRQFKHTQVPAGQIRLEYRHYPFLGPESRNSAMAAECAAEQDRFWEYHDYLYEASHQQVPFSKDLYDRIAVETGLDLPQWDQCYTQERYSKQIDLDFRYGRSLGVQGTPYVYVNGVHYVGDYDYFSIIDHLDSLSETPSSTTPDASSNDN